ncbi:MAG: cob(I)yrinic acid a,c-diamide adenosyltransferase [Xanthomonadales bacterium]|nr:cob(I)yrinic acid a,c-diamide adenosyltransferase [Xanthomonadales bacterium]
MGKRLTKIYTRTGDDGSTGLGDGSRVPKDDERVEAYGTVDELNSAVGVLIAHLTDDKLNELLLEIQHDLFDVGGELCLPGYSLIKQERVEWLEQHLDELNAPLPALENFILPGGSAPAAHCHMARTICRRAERRVHSLQNSQADAVGPVPLKYLNRLSDLLFVVARVISRQDGVGEVQWRRPR